MNPTIYGQLKQRANATKELLSFSTVNSNVLSLRHNIAKYRELKLRLLNAAHTFSCALAYLNGFNTVSEAMQNESFLQFIKELMFVEIIPCIIGNEITKEEAEAFANHVINRFQNPFIQHQWLSISMQYTNKMKQRCVPLIEKYHQNQKPSQSRMALGFAAYLLFTKPVVIKEDFILWKTKQYRIFDPG